MIVQQRVIFGDTDQMGVVYHANHFRFFEGARAEYLRQLGMSGKDLDNLGIGFPVIEAHCNYKKPAHYEDLLDIDITVSKLTGASVTFTYSLLLDGVVLATGHTIHVAVGRSGKACAIPAEIKELISKHEGL